MRRVRLYTLAEDEKLLALRLVHNGLRGNGGLPTIAKKMGRAVSSVRHRLMTLAEYDDGAIVRRRGWSEEEAAKLLEWRAQGVTMRECGKRLGRSLESIKAKLALPNRRKRHGKENCADRCDAGE